MNARKAKHQFGAIPVRAISDKRLSAADWRVLGAIARSDSFGKNGRHCYANQTTIGEWANVTRTTANKSIGKLHDLGYVAITRLNGRREYSIVYEECAEMSTPEGTECAEMNTPSVPDSTHINKELKYLPQSMEINSPKVRPPEGCAPQEGNPQGWLAKVERDIRQRGFVTDGQRQGLAEIEESAACTGYPEENAILGQVERIHELIYEIGDAQ